MEKLVAIRPLENPDDRGFPAWRGEESPKMEEPCRRFIRRGSATCAIVGPTVLASIAAVDGGGLATNRIRRPYPGPESAFVLETTEITLKIEERIKAYRQVLWGARALFAASQQVTRQEWHQYVFSSGLHTDYAGIWGGLRAPPVLSANQLASHERSNIPRRRLSKLSGQPAWAARSAGAIVYLEPFDWRNQRPSATTCRPSRYAMKRRDRARTLGVAAMSGKGASGSETSTDIQPGVLLYLPVFRTDARSTIPSAAGKRPLSAGFTCPFRLGDLIAGTPR